METKRICPGCGKTLAPSLPLGLCPQCLIISGFKTGTDPKTGARRDFTPPAVQDLAKLFPQLEILELIGHGGMGAVYKARQPALDRCVALKILAPYVAADARFAERFNREARALARLSHPNIVAVHDFGRADGLHFLIMEYVDGANLRQIQQAGQFTPEQALQIVPQICDALQFAHRAGVVHRDIKPENILLTKAGHVKITDFGIAKILGQTENKVGLTGAKDVVGTPHYMAPEQVEKPQLVDHRADIYSLGVVFYEMLTGELPLGKFAPPSCKVQVDIRLDEVVLRALEKEPERRYQHATEVKTDIATITNSPPVHTESVVLRQVRWPAIGLITTGALNLLVGSILMLAVLLSLWAVNSNFDLEGIMNLFPEWFYDPAHRTARVLLAVAAITWFGISAVTVAGGQALLKLQSRSLVVAAAICGMLATPGAYIGLPVGIWVLVVVARFDVRRAFRGSFPVKRAVAWILASIALPIGTSLLVMFATGGPRLEAARAGKAFPSATWEPGSRREMNALAAAEVRSSALTRDAATVAASQIPPVVVTTVPESGARNVEPSLTELRVTFSKTMEDKRWSWTALTEASFPDTTGIASYLEDGRTCVLPVKLQPGKVYALWLNSERFKNFVDSNGLPALPYLLVFETKERSQAQLGNEDERN